MKLGIVGLGKMGEAIVRGVQASPEKKAIEIEATTKSPESAKKAKANLGIACSEGSNLELAKRSDVILLSVKPHQAEKALREIAPALTPKKLLISIVAAVTTSQIRRWTGSKCSIVRAMPNTPCLIREGMTVLSPSPDTDPAPLAVAQKIFACLGLTTEVEESLLDGVTGLSGCGPAYVFLVIEALSEAGVKVGLPRETATLLAAQTLVGASKMVLERKVHPAALKDEVTTPAGCTIDGLMALEEGKVRVAMIKAVLAATKRSKTLSP